MNCAICTDIKYDPKNYSYHICNACLVDPTLVCAGDPITNKYGMQYYAIANRDGVYSIKSVIEEGLKYYKDSPAKLKKINKYKDEWETKRQNQIKKDTYRKNIIDSVKLAAEKFSVKLDFTTNTVMNIIQNRFTNDENSDILSVLIINDLDNHANIIKDEANAKQLVDDRIKKLDTVVNDNLKAGGLYIDADTHSKLVEKLKEYPPIKAIYDKLAVEDKGDEKELFRSIYLTISEMCRIYQKAKRYTDELGDFGIAI